MDQKVPLKKRRSNPGVGPPEEPKVIMSAKDREEEEFQEFREADTGPLEASPEFKEGLRKKLLKLMKNLYGLWMLYLGGVSPFN